MNSWYRLHSSWYVLSALELSLMSWRLEACASSIRRDKADCRLLLKGELLTLIVEFYKHLYSWVLLQFCRCSPLIQTKGGSTKKNWRHVVGLFAIVLFFFWRALEVWVIQIVSSTYSTYGSYVYILIWEKVECAFSQTFIHIARIGERSYPPNDRIGFELQHKFYSLRMRPLNVRTTGWVWPLSLVGAKKEKKVTSKHKCTHHTILHTCT
jgi:hypothetical protein